MRNGLVVAPAWVLRLAVTGILVAVPTGRAESQLPDAPQPTLGPAGSCPAVARFEFDVSSIQGANRVLWQLRRGTPNQGFAAATEVDEDVAVGASGFVEKDLREFGPVLDGTRYFFRVRARQGGTNVSEFSPPVRFDVDVSPDGMFSAGAGSSADGLRVDWTLTGAIAACADRAVVRVLKADGTASVTGGGAGTAGGQDVDLSAHGPGDYDVRVRAGFGSSGDQDAIGRESAPVRVTVAAAAAGPELSIDDVSFPEGNAGNSRNAVVRLSAPASQTVSVLVGARPGGTATEGACAAGRDVTFAFRTVTIAAGQPQVSVPFTICGDAVQEPDESFSLGLLNPVNATISDDTGIVTVRNDDDPTPPPPPAPLNVSLRDVILNEGNSNNTQNAIVTLSAPTNRSVRVLIGARPGGTATEGACAAGRDVTFALRTVTLDAGQTELSVPFTICGDTVFENDETFSLGLTGVVNAALGDSIGQVTIRNDDIGVEQPRVQAPSLPNLQVTIDGRPQFATQLGPPLVHAVTVTNTGVGVASNVVVQSTLPRGVRFVRVEENQFDGCTGGVITDAATGQALVRCTASSLAAGSSRGVRIVGEVAGPIADGARVVFGANADPFKAVAEADEADNFAFLSTIVRFPADLRIATADLDTLNINRPFGGIRGLIEGAGADFTFHYQWTVTNNGPPASPPTTLRIQWPTAGIQVFGGDGNAIPLREDVSIPALAPNASSVVARTVILRTFTGEPRAASVSATVDPDRVFDSFVGNNTFTLLVNLQ